MDKQSNNCDVKNLEEVRSGSNGYHDNPCIFVTTTVSPDLVPQVGQVFLTLHEADRFYGRYACEAGFNIRSNSTKYVTDKSTQEQRMVMKLFTCAKEGKFLVKHSTPMSCSAKHSSHSLESNTEVRMKQKRRVRVTRTNCKASLRLKYNDKKWNVSQSVSAHNHAMV